MRKFLTLIILLIAPAVHATDFAGHELLIPIAGRTPGALGSQWRTDLYVTNADRRSVSPGQEVTIIYSVAGAADTVVTRTIDPLATLVLKDAILHSFGSEQSVGIIRILAAPNAKITARARIYNIGSPQGEFGQTVPAFPAAKLARETYLPGLSGLGGNRTNVGVANPSGEEAVVFLSLFADSGDFRGGFSAAVPPHGVLLLNDVFSHFQGGPLEGAMLRVGSSHGVYPYASIVRNDSGDADFVPGTGVVLEDHNAVVTPPCANPAPLHLAPAPAAGWIVTFHSGTDALAATTQLSGKYGFVPLHIYEHALLGFHAELTAQSIAALRCEPAVKAVEQNGLVRPGSR